MMPKNSWKTLYLKSRILAKASLHVWVFIAKQIYEGINGMGFNFDNT